MEFNARYAITGVFAIAVIAAVLGFVYWLRDEGGFGAQTQYLVRFTVPVSGLATGSGVLFNGIKVGEVRGLRRRDGEPHVGGGSGDQPYHGGGGRHRGTGLLVTSGHRAGERRRDARTVQVALEQ